jgi:predicted phage-related endonuclease
MYDVAVTRLTGLMPDRYVSKAMEYGIEYEPLARAAYEKRFDVDVKEVGFAIHPKIDWFGASPDGLVGNDGVLEIKCPNSATHLSYLMDGVVPEDYLPQMKAEMLCAERQWCDFVSFDPRMPKHLRLFVRRLERDEPMLRQLEEEVEKFLNELEVLMEKISNASPVVRGIAEPF